jgi:T5SS/PEP-CTERM-associated repeat protein
VIIGRRGSGVGTISVSGANSKLDAVDGHLVVGFGSLTTADTPGGRGNLIVFNGGAVHSVNGYIARNPGGIGSVTLLGGGRWDMDGSLFVGGNDAATGGVGRIFQSGGAIVAPVSTTCWNNGAIFFTAGTFETGTLTLTGGGQVQMSGGQVGVTTTLKTTALSIETSTLSQLDLADNRLIVDYTGTSPLSSIRSLIQTGFNNGPWNGNAGILSSFAATASTTPNKTGIGYVEATNIFSTFPGSFGGYAIDNTSVLARYTLLGDANIDLAVDIADFSRLAANFNVAGPWFNGDFNYDGVTDIGDFALLASNFNKSLPSDLPRQSIPEPSATGAAFLAALTLLFRCRRSGKQTSD